MPELRREQRNP